MRHGVDDRVASKVPVGGARYRHAVTPRDSNADPSYFGECARRVTAVVATAGFGSRLEDCRVTKEAHMTSVLVRYEDPGDAGERAGVAGFLASYSGTTRVSYSTDLRLFATWCQSRGRRLLEARRADLEIFA